MNQGNLIAASKQREQIPVPWQIEFTDWTNLALASFITDSGVTNKELKAYALWELTYRQAAGIMVDLSPEGLPRHLVTNDDYADAIEDDKRERPKIDRSRFEAYAEASKEQPPPTEPPAA